VSARADKIDIVRGDITRLNVARIATYTMRVSLAVTDQIDRVTFILATGEIFDAYDQLLK